MASDCAAVLRRRSVVVAIARLYDAMPPPPARPRAFSRGDGAFRGGTARPLQPQRYATGIARRRATPHRRVPVRSWHRQRCAHRQFPDTADDVATRVDDVLALRDDRLPMRWTTREPTASAAFGGAFCGCAYSRRWAPDPRRAIDSERDDISARASRPRTQGICQRDTVAAESAGEQFVNAFASQPTADGRRAPSGIADRVGDLAPTRCLLNWIIITGNAVTRPRRRQRYASTSFAPAGAAEATAAAGRVRGGVRPARLVRRARSLRAMRS
jgi:hypothetical protein